MFHIDVGNMYWITDEDNPYDLCAHGKMIAIIGDERFEFDGAVSSTAIYLLKTLSQNHSFGEDNQMMPCCGHFIIADNSMENVQILGCCNGIDWEVTHIGNKIGIKTESGQEIFVDFEKYREVVFKFADKVEKFYKSCSDKVFSNEYEKNGYIAFWNEWNRRRYGKQNSILVNDGMKTHALHKKERRWLREKNN